MVKYKMMINWKEYDGAYTVDECGENVKVALNSMPELYNPSFAFTKVNDDGSPYTIKSTKKSKSQPTSFSDMVAKQRSKNINKTIYGTANFSSLCRGFDELGSAEQWWIITYLKDKLGMNGFEEFIDNVVAYAHDKYEGE